MELGPRGIRALAVAPGFVTTEGIAAASDQVRTYIGGEPVEKIAAGSPLGRVVAPDDVGRVVLLAVSNLAHAMTGSTLIVDAGVVASG